MPTPYTMFSGTDKTLLTNALLAPNSGITINPGSIVLNASGPTAVNFYDGSLAALGIGAGVLLTSGTAPPLSNTLSWFSADNSPYSGFYNGDPDIDNVVNTVFPTVSYDATTLAFDFTVADPNATSISFDLVFGTDEYPEWVDTVFVDSAMTLVNGTNYALFNHDPMHPLSVISSNLTANYFQDNANNVLPIEYDGVSYVLKIIAPIIPGGAVNHIKIGVADTGDHIYDSGLFLANFSSGYIPGSGIVITPPDTGTSGSDNITGSPKDEYFDLKGGDDTCYAGAGDDIVVGGSGNDIIYGGSGNDEIEGDGGNDLLDGGDGTNDTVTYLGSSSDFNVTYNSLDNSFTFVDSKTTANAEGTDTLSNIEYAKFSNGLFTLGINGLTPVTNPGPLPINSPGLVSISGIGSEGKILTATVSDANGVSSAINYQWQLSSDGGITWSNIGANSSTYTVAASDADQAIQVIASYTDGISTSEAAVSAPKSILATNNGDLVVTLMQLTAPAGATNINPLTTLIQDAIDLGVSPNMAALNIKTVLGIPSTVNLLTYDAWSILQNNPSEPTALMVELAAIQAAILTSLSDDDSGINLTLAILNAAANNQTLDLANANDLAGILGIDISGITDKNLYPQPLREIYDRNKTMSDAIADGGNVNDIENEWQDLLSIQDNINSTSIADLSIHINQAPIGSAAAILANGMADTAYVVSSNDLLTGFSDPDGGQLTIDYLSADNGTVTTLDGLSFTVMPNAGYSGPIELSYQISDGQGGSVNGFQLFVVQPVIANHAPQLTGLPATLATGNEDSAYPVNDIELLTGWVDADSDSLYVTNLATDHGSVTVNGDGTYTIEPEANYNGAVTLSYGVSDGTDTVSASLGFNLAAVNDAPQLTGVAATLADGTEDTDYMITAATLLAGWSDVDGDTLSIQNLTANHGTVINNGGGNYTVQPEANYNGPVTLDYQVSDSVTSIAASLNINLATVNDAPSFTKGTDQSSNENSGSQTVTGWATGISAGPSDESNQTLSFLASNDNNALFAAQPEIDANGNLTYTPAANASGSATVTVTLKDNGGTALDGIDTSVAQIFTITINANNLAPVLNAPLVNQAIKFDNNLNYGAGALFSDPDGDTLTFSAALTSGNSLPGWMQINSATGVISGTPAFGDRGTYALTVIATDTHAASIAAPMTIAATVFNAGQLLVSTVGNDLLTGTAGIDTVTYDYAPSPVTVSLANLAAQVTGFGSDTLNGIENLIGSTANDALTGNGLANVLDGGAGADQLNGGTGNDTYVIDNTGDVIVESNKGGTDLVLTWITLPLLANNVENLTVLGSDNANASGNALANTLTGNSGDNILDGKSGTDKLFGGAGNDTYVVDNTGDTITENANEGSDTVQSTVSFTLGNNVESLTLLQNLAINGIGNSLDNILTGSGGNNTLNGMAGNDTISGGNGSDILIGGAGLDHMTGGTGTDIFRLATLTDSNMGANRDVILDFSKVEVDKIDVSGIDAKSATSKNDAFVWNGTADFTAAGQLHYLYDNINNVTIVEGNVDTTLTADFQIQLAGNIALAVTDFTL